MKTKVKRLTKAQKRVLIAKDVIKQVKAGLTGAKHFYCAIPELSKLAVAGDELKPLIKKRKCFGCAKGSMFLAHIRRWDEVKAPETYNGKAENWSLDDEGLVCEPLLGYFSKLQLDLIECAYEGRDISCRLDWTIRRHAIDFGQKHSSNSARLIAICKNIVLNKGTFKP